MWVGGGGVALFRHVYDVSHCHLTRSLFSLCHFPNVELNLEVNEAGGAQRLQGSSPQPGENNTSCKFNARSTHWRTPMCVYAHWRWSKTSAKGKTEAKVSRRVTHGPSVRLHAHDVKAYGDLSLLIFLSGKRFSP